ncbi:MAG: leucine-rich repeat protein [Bacilli bacterium]|nr:leucine-rich repeat protein [Bacilli bacterium]
MNNKKLFALSVAALLGFGTVGSLGIRAFSKPAVVAGNQVLHETTKADTIGEAIAFGNHIKRAGEADSVAPVIGVQIMDGATEGTKSLRFVAALTGYQGLAGAKWSRAAIVDGETVIKEASEFEVEAVYTSVADAESIKWSTAPGEEYTYYMVYTLANIPAQYAYAAVNVTFNVTDLAGTVSTPVTQAANVKGVQGTGYVGIKVAESKIREGEYNAYKENTSIKEAYIPEDAVSVNGYVATYLGKITGLDETTTASTNSNGAFENCSYLEKITLPATIKYIDSWCFSRCSKLTEFTLPRDLTEMAGSVFGTTSIATLYWNATNFTTLGGSSWPTANTEVIMAAGVQAIPSTDFFGATSASVKKVTFGGTELEWAALIDGKTTKMDIDNVICSDSVLVTYTYHLNGGTVNGSGDDIVSSVKVGKKAENIKPLKTGMKFAGWYTAAEGGDLVDMDAAVTAAKEIYAHYEALPAGNSLQEPRVINPGDSFAMETFEGMNMLYFEFTAEESGHYWLINKNNTVAQTIGTTGVAPRFRAWNEDGTEITVNYISRTNGAEIQHSNTANQSYSACTIDAVAGKTYRISWQMYYSSYSGYADYRAYGTANFEFFKSTDNDSRANATVIDPASASVQHVLPVNGSSDCINWYKFTATEDKSYYYAPSLDGSTWSGQYVFEENEETGALTQKAYVYGTNNTASGALLEAKAGKTYYIALTWNSNNTNNDDSKYAGFTLGNPPAGSSMDNPAAGVISADGSKVAITKGIVGTASNYYSVTIDEAGTYDIGADTTTTTYGMKLTLINAAGEEVATVQASKTGSGYWASYGKSIETSVELEAGTYTLVTSWIDQTSWPSSTTMNVSVAKNVPGSKFANALDLTFEEGSAAVTTTIANTYYKFRAAAGPQLLSATGDATKIELYSSSKALLKTWTAEDAEAAYYVFDATDYYLVVTGTGSSTVSMAPTALRPDGTSREKAYTIVRDENHQMDLLQYQKSTTQSSCYFKYQINNPGIYRIWTRTTQTSTRMDTKLNGIWKDEATTKIGFRTGSTGTFTTNTVDDDSGKNPTYCGHNYDFYAEFEVTEAGTYYFAIQISATNDTIQSSFVGIENTDPAGDDQSAAPVDPTPETPSDDNPSKPTTYVGRWDFDGVKVLINENETGIIGEGADAQGFGYEYSDGDLTILGFDSFGGTYSEGLFTWDEEAGTLTAYVYGDDASLYDVVGTPVVDAPAYIGHTYTGKIGMNNQTIVFTSATECTWNNVALSYTVSGSTITVSGIFDEGITLIYNEAGNSFAVSYEDDCEPYSGSLAFVQ